ncbi:malto-oligosyltrehalose trehalohydrolase [Nitrospira sp. Kam-Ns4a]
MTDAEAKPPWQLDLGARPVGPDAVRFRVWAPKAGRVAVRLFGPDGRPLPHEPVPLAPAGGGYYEGTVSGARAGLCYRYRLDDALERPDPASRFQPQGVHSPSMIVDPDAFGWTDQGWPGRPLRDLILYELHVGTFTPEGTFEAIIPHLDYLRDELGVTAIELMPVAQFPGARNWGYDGVYPFAPQATYGGPEGLKRLVDACHARGLAVCLDVVYNHLGPEGNYLACFGPYFTDRYRTPWGEAINYDGPDSDAIRHFFISNALYWVTEYHVDALRLDAIHGIFDSSARPILRELAAAVHAQARALSRTILVIAESDQNDVRVITPADEGGYGLDAQWNDDFHHALRAQLTSERAGYYQDFGRLEQVATALQEGFVYTGQYSTYRRRRHGSSSRHRPAAQLVVFAQNHDQVGNRARGDRLTTQVPPEALRVAAAAVLFAPNVPLLFMGEEYGEPAPFQYFTDHGDPALQEAVRQGRRREFAAFGWREELPDPQDPATFERSRLRLESRTEPERAALLRWYRALIALRRAVPALAASEAVPPTHRVWTFEPESVLAMHRWHPESPAALVVLSFSKNPAVLTLREPVGAWRLRLDAATAEFGGSGSNAAPAALIIAGTGASLRLPAYAAAVYLAEP